MPISILMPALSPTMTEGNLAKWHKKAGDTVSAGDVIAEIETDKATMEVEAVDEGVLAKILVDEGAEGVAVNTAIAVILEDGESESDLEGFSTGPAPAPAAAPAAVVEAAPAAAAPQPAAAAPAAAAQPAAAAAVAPVAASSGGRVFASPLARRLAAQAGLDLAGVTGSGPGGRIVKADVEGAKAGGVAPVAAAGVAAAPALEGDAPYELQPASTMRKVIAARLTESKQTVPHFYLTVDCEIDQLLNARKQMNEIADGAFKVSVNDMVIKALAVALKKVPAANASWSSDGIRRYSRVDVSVAVAIEGGLITPVVRGAEHKGLKAIAEEMVVLAGKARDGKLVPEEYQGGTVSVSNMGMFGIKEFAAVINPPQGSILAIGAGQQRPVVHNGELAVATVMSCTLSADHRVVDGAVGAELLATFKKLVENPAAMLL